MTDRNYLSRSALSPSVLNRAHGLTTSDNWLEDRIVVVTVGPEKRRWVLHENLLTKKSDFFKEHFAAGNEELELPNDDPRLFDLFIRWVYGTTCLLDGAIVTRQFRFARQLETLTVRDYLGLYVMGLKFRVVGVRNAVADALYSLFGPPSNNHQPPSMHDVRYLFDNTPPDSPMRRLLTAHLLFYFFCKDRVGLPLPRDWAAVLPHSPDISLAMFVMLTEWNWAIGHNAPRMSIRPREEFLEKVPQAHAIKEEADERAI